MEPAVLLSRLDGLVEDDRFARALARALVGRDDADDVAQEAWLRTLSRPETIPSAPRRWLSVVVNRLASNLRRTTKRRLAREAAVARSEAVSAADRFSSRNELHRRLAAAVLALEPTYADAIVLRYVDGLPPRAIAARLAIPVATVKTRLKRALARLRARLDADVEGGRSSWMRALLPFAETIMTVKAKLSVAGVVAAIVFGAYGALKAAEAPRSLTTTDAIAAPGGADSLRKEETPQLPEIRSAPVARASFVESAPTATPSRAFSVLVDVVFEDDGAPVVDAPTWNSLEGQSGAVRRTDASGRAVFPAAGARLFCPMSPFGAGSPTPVNPGADTTITLRVLRGVHVVGLVVDAEDRPIANAAVHAEASSARRDAPVAFTDASGAFDLRGLRLETRLYAIAAGCAASDSVAASAALVVDDAVRVTLRCAEKGWFVRGSVVDRRGAPIRDADLQINFGARRTRSKGLSGEALDAPWPSARSDADGRFVCGPSAPRTGLLEVRAEGFARSTSPIEIVAGRDTEAIVTLDRGGVVSGVVRDGAGAPLNGVMIEVIGEQWMPDTIQSDAEGAFRFEHVAPGARKLVARRSPIDVVATELAVEEGGAVQWDPRFAPRASLAGRLVDDAGAPLAAWVIGASLRSRNENLPRGVGFHADAVTDDGGRFRFDDLGEGRFALDARPKDAPPGPGQSIADDAHADDQERDYVVNRAKTPSAWIVGRVVDDAGAPLPGATVSGFGRWVKTDSPQGAFRLGPFAPRTGPLTVEHPRLPGRRIDVAISRSDETVDCGEIRLEKGGALRIDVTAPEDAPRAAPSDLTPRPLAAVSIFDKAGVFIQNFWIDRAGKTVNLPVGSYVVRSCDMTDGPKYAAVSVSARVARDAESRVEVKLTPGVLRTLSFRPPPDANAEELRVVIGNSDGGRSFEGALRRTGVVFTLTLRLATGPHTVHAALPCGAKLDGAFDVAVGAGDQAEPLIFELR